MGLHPDILSFLGPGPEIPGRSMLAGAADAKQRPFVVRAVGARLQSERGTVSVFFSKATSEHLVRLLAPGSSLAVCFNQPTTHRSIQIKGQVQVVEPATEADRALLDRYVQQFAAELDLVGLPERVVRRLSHWPAYRVELRPDQVFDQTPGPGAGLSISGSKGAR